MHNTVSMVLFLLVRWIFFFAVTVLYLAAVDLWANLGALAFALSTVGVLRRSPSPTTSWSNGWSGRCMALRPQGCSIYDRAFWRHERFWKV